MHVLARDLQLDLRRHQELARQLHLSRATLGSILDWLECSDLGPELLEELQTYVEDIGVEIDELVEALPDLLGGKST